MCVYKICHVSTCRVYFNIVVSMQHRSQLDQLTTTLANIQAQLSDMTQNLNQNQERLAKLEIDREPPKTEEPPVQPNARRNTQHNAPKMNNTWEALNWMYPPSMDAKTPNFS